MSAEEKIKYQQLVQQEQTKRAEELRHQKAVQSEILKDMEKRKEAGEEIDEAAYKRLMDQQKATTKNLASANAMIRSAAKKEDDITKKQRDTEINFRKKIKSERIKADKEELDTRRMNLDVETKKKLEAIEKEKISEEEKEKKIKELRKDYKKQERDINKEQAKSENPTLAEQFSPKALVGYLYSTLSKLGDELDTNIKNIMQLWADNEAKFNSRLEQTVKSDNSLRSTMDDFTENYAAANAYIKQEDLMKKAIEAVDAGIAYNIEERAFLGTIADSIQSTFDAFDSNLLQIIRLQRADMTASQLGLESFLNDFLLRNFQDTSYLTDMYDNIQGALIDLTSTMDRDTSTEVLYEIQKWLGSLYSMGASGNLVTTIAQGLNYLGTGNIEGLFGNQATNTLFGLASSYSGTDYADLIRDGLNASSINKLMTSMVDYLRDIATSESENILVQGAFNQVFGTTMSDIRALTNFTADDIANISDSSLTYEQAMIQTQNDLSRLSDRVSTVTKLSNVWDNYMYSSAFSVADNPIGLLTYKILNIVEDVTGGISLPSVFAMGTGASLDSFRLTQLAKGAMFGLSMLGNVGTLTSALGGSMNGVSVPQFEEYMSGGGFSTSGTTGVSGASAYIGSGSSDDMKQSSLASATDDVDSAKEISDSVKDDDEHDFNDWYNNCIEEDRYVRTYDELSHETLQKIYEAMTFLSNQERVQLVQIESIGNDLSLKGIPVKQLGTPIVQVTQATGKDLMPLIVKSTADESITHLEDMISDFTNGTSAMTVKTNDIDKLQVEVQW